MNSLGLNRGHVNEPTVYSIDVTYRSKLTNMSVLLVVGRKCTLAASHAAPPPGESRWVCWRDRRRTDRQTPGRYIRFPLGPVHTSNIVEATFDFVEATFDFVATNGNNVVRHFVLSTKSKQIEHAQFISTVSKGRNFVRHCCRNRQHCCQKRQQCRNNIRHCWKNR